MEQGVFDALIERMAQGRWVIYPVENPERTKRKWFVGELGDGGVGRHGGDAEWEEDDLLRLMDEIHQHIKTRPLVVTIEGGKPKFLTERVLG